MIADKFSHFFAQLGLSVHDISVAALAAAVILLGAVLLMELRCVLRLRGVMDSQLGRVFEQLDLLRFETQQLLEGQQSVMPTPAERAAHGADSAAPAPPWAGPVALPPAAALRTTPTVPATTPGPVYQNAAALVASGASSQEIAERLGLASGEARLLSSLAQARARRAQAAGA
jgi:hypothetical protein